MKVFISWSGDYSREIAKKLSVWIPSIIQSVDTFFSPDDIGKGENWSNRISQELDDCNFGIICLTPENVAAPWIHFEAGALAKTLDSHVSSVMLSINPSEVKGPLSRFQNTKFERDDFFKLLRTINTASERPIPLENLTYLFDALWGRMSSEIGEIIKKHESTPATPEAPDKNNDGEAIQEILGIVRKMSSKTSFDKGAETVESEPSRTIPNKARLTCRISLRKHPQADSLADETKHVFSKCMSKGMVNRAISSLENDGEFHYTVVAPLSVIQDEIMALSKLPDIIVTSSISN